MSAVVPRSRAASPWRSALAALVALEAAILLLYGRSLAGMVEIWWRSETFAHAFLVLPISLWLAWRQRARLREIAPRPSPWLILALAALAAFWLLSDLATVNVASQFALVAMLVLAVPCVLGLEVAWALLFPLLFLFFMVPFGEFLLPTLMQHTADFTVWALRATGIPVYREGQTFVIPSGTWSVVEACSGIRYLIASLMVGALFAYLNYRSWQRRAAFMAVATVVPIVANWLRAYMIVMLGDLSGNRIAVGVDHLIYGWLFFGIVITIMFLIGSRWSEPEAPAPEAGGAATAATVRAAGATRSWPALGAALAAAAVLAAAPALEHRIEQGESAAGEPRLALPDHLGSQWSASAGAAPADWKPRYLNPNLLASRLYDGPEGRVGVYVAYYRNQGPESKLISSENMLVVSTDHHWNEIESRRIAWQGAPGVASVQSARIVGALQLTAVQDKSLSVWVLNWADGRWVDSDLGVTIANGRGRLRGRGDDCAAVILYAAGPPAAASARVEAFARANLGKISELLEHTREQR
ncbi:MAG: exosortase A [Burkholderiales bacterium]|nr:exosortase A [Burkholderiales bacterium]